MDAWTCPDCRISSGSSHPRLSYRSLNTSVRRFLKKVGITSQREIEKAVRDAVASGRLKGNEALPAKVTLTVGEVGVNVEIAGDIELQ